MASKSVYPPSVKPGIPKIDQIPNGWRKTTFGDVLDIVTRSAKLQDDKDYQLVNAKRNRGGIVPRDIKYGKDIKTKTQFYVKSGDFVISRRQIVHGACGIVPDKLDGALVSNEYTAFSAKVGISLDYLRWYSHSTHIQQTCFHSSIGVAIEKMVFRQDEWLEEEVPIPPLAEQKQITELLDTWQRAIDNIAKLVEIKQKLKKSLMQKLLTGEQRFPEFGLPAAISDLPDGWSKVKLGDVAEILFSGVDKHCRYGERPVRLCNYLDVFNNQYIDLNLDFMMATATDAEIEKYTLRRDDVIITKDSETPDDIANSATVIEDTEGVICGYHLGILRPKQGLDGLFLGSLLMLPRIRYEFSRIANGATRFGLTLSAIAKVPIWLPDNINEQKRIASVFFSLNNEIKRLLNYLNQLQEQKRGLMQKLLTGKVRVKGS